MYFASRLQAGRMLATKLADKYRYENCVVLALNDGGVMVGAQIAKELHCVLNLLTTAEIGLPREPVPVAGISSDGSFVYNYSEYSGADLTEMISESRGYIEEEKLQKLHQMNHLVGADGLVSRELLAGYNIILVADGLKSNFSLELAVQFLKPIRVEKIIVATPLAGVNVVDWIHLHADEIYCLSVVEEYMDTAHYYDTQDIPERPAILETIRRIILDWK